MGCHFLPLYVGKLNVFTKVSNFSQIDLKVRFGSLGKINIKFFF